MVSWVAVSIAIGVAAVVAQVIFHIQKQRVGLKDDQISLLKDRLKVLDPPGVSNELRHAIAEIELQKERAVLDARRLNDRVGNQADEVSAVRQLELQNDLSATTNEINRLEAMLMGFAAALRASDVLGNSIPLVEAHMAERWLRSNEESVCRSIEKEICKGGFELTFDQGDYSSSTNDMHSAKVGLLWHTLEVSDGHVAIRFRAVADATLRFNLIRDDENDLNIPELYQVHGPMIIAGSAFAQGDDGLMDLVRQPAWLEVSVFDELLFTVDAQRELIQLAPR